MIFLKWLKKNVSEYKFLQYLKKNGFFKNLIYILKSNLYFRGTYLVFEKGKYVVKDRDWGRNDFHFDNVMKGMLTLFTVSTFEGWPGWVYLDDIFFNYKHASIQVSLVQFRMSQIINEYTFLFFRLLYVSIDSNAEDRGPITNFRPIVAAYYIIYIIIIAFFMVRIIIYHLLFNICSQATRSFTLWHILG